VHFNFIHQPVQIIKLNIFLKSRELSAKSESVVEPHPLVQRHLEFGVLGLDGLLSL